MKNESQKKAATIKIKPKIKEDIIEIQEHKTNNALLLGHDINQIKNNFEALKLFGKEVHKNLTANVDYGKITQDMKPTLYKSGMEKIILLFGLVPKIEILENTRDIDKKFVAYTIKATLYSKNGVVISTGMGHANNREKGKTNQDFYTLFNNLLKIAIKRAKMDAVLGVAALSGVFTHDINDPEKEGNNELIVATSKFDRLKLFSFAYKTTYGKSRTSEKEKQKVKDKIFPLLFKKYKENNKTTTITQENFISNAKVSYDDIDKLKDLFIEVLGMEGGKHGL